MVVLKLDSLTSVGPLLAGCAAKTKEDRLSMGLDFFLKELDHSSLEVRRCPILLEKDVARISRVPKLFEGFSRRSGAIAIAPRMV